MINEPAIDTLIENLGEKYNGSKYVLCVVAAKRARQLIDISKHRILSPRLGYSFDKRSY